MRLSTPTVIHFDGGLLTAMYMHFLYKSLIVPAMASQLLSWRLRSTFPLSRPVGEAAALAAKRATTESGRSCMMASEDRDARLESVDSQKLAEPEKGG